MVRGAARHRLPRTGPASRCGGRSGGGGAGGRGARAGRRCGRVGTAAAAAGGSGQARRRRAPHRCLAPAELQARRRSPAARGSPGKAGAGGAAGAGGGGRGCAEHPLPVGFSPRRGGLGGGVGRLLKGSAGWPGGLCPEPGRRGGDGGGGCRGPQPGRTEPRSPLSLPLTE